MLPVPWEAGILPHQHIPKGTTGSAAPAAPSPRLNDGKHLSVGRRRAHNTFLVLLHDRGRRRSNFHGKAIGSPEGVAVSDDESPRLPVLQQGNGCRREQQSSEAAENQHTPKTTSRCGLRWGAPAPHLIARHHNVTVPPARLRGLPGTGSPPPTSTALVWASSIPTLPTSEKPSTGEQAGTKAQMLGPSL